MDITKFNEKLNRLSGNVYTIEEEVIPVNGVYEAPLMHDNVTTSTINVYTGSKLTGDKINTISFSTPSLTPWKTIIKIFSSAPKLYISYEATGDQVEAEDINNLQDAVVETQESLNNEINRATGAEKVLTDNLNTEISRAKSSENTLTINLNSEITRAKSAESILTTNLDFEINRAKTKESSIDAELSNRYTKDKVYTKDEVLQKISELINNAPNVLDTFKEIADALGNDPNFATTMTTMLAGKVDKVSGKGLSTNDYTDTEKANLADTNNKKHEHGNKSVIDGITATLIGYWNAAYTHISDSVKHITSDERTLWNTVSNKVDKITGKSLSTNDFDNNYKGKIDGISSNANKVEVSTTNGNIKIDGAEKTVYTHPSGTNPHGTTKTDVGLGNVTNDPQVKRSEMGVASGVATLDSSGVNSQAPKPHTHDDRYYTETEINNIVGSETLTTVATTIKGAINEVKATVTSGGSVDNSLKLNNQTADYYLNYINFTNKPTSLPANGGNADTVDGFHASQTAGSANAAVIRDGNGYIQNTWFNSNRGSENSNAAQYIYDTGDGYMRKKDLSNVRAELVTAPFGLGGLAIDISSQDCNNIVNTGFYRGNNCTNRCPGSHTWTYLIVVGHDTGSWISQIGINYNNDGTYVRAKINGIWSAWRRLDATATSQITNDSGFITASSSISGNAATATKLQSARAISLAGVVLGNVSFDGSANVSITTTLKTGLTWNDLEGV